MRTRPATVLALAALASAAACTSAGTSAVSTSDVTPSVLHHIACPSAVDTMLVIQHDCLRLTTPESPGSSRTVDVFVLRMTPSGQVSSDPLLILGSDLGDAPDYGGYSPAPSRVHRVVYVMDPRGTGHSTPSLACPEADGLAAGSSDESPSLLSAVRQCRERLGASGIDIQSYGASGVARDARSLREALGVRSWNIQTLGTTSAYVPATVTADPGSVRSIVLDSPYEPVASTSSTERAWSSLVSGCARSAGCASAHGDARSLWRRATKVVATAPLHVGAVEVGPELLERFVRSMLAGEGPVPPVRLLDDLAGIVAGRIPLDLQHRVSSDGPCLGYRPTCPGRSFSLGAYLTVTCGIPVATDSPTGATARDPFVEACPEWPVSPGESGSLGAVPTLQLRGALDPFAASPQPTEAGAARYAVVVPGQTHNVLGYDECPIAIRNAWIDAPGSPPASDCVAAVPPIAVDAN